MEGLVPRTGNTYLHCVLLCNLIAMKISNKTQLNRILLWGGQQTSSETSLGNVSCCLGRRTPSPSQCCSCLFLRHPHHAVTPPKLRPWRNSSQEWSETSVSGFRLLLLYLSPTTQQLGDVEQVTQLQCLDFLICKMHTNYNNLKGLLFRLNE